MCEWVAAARRGAGVLGNVADAQEQLKCRRQRGQPQQKWRPSPYRQRYREQYRLHSQEPAHGARGRFGTFHIGDWRADTGSVLHVERPACERVSLTSAIFAPQHRGYTAQRRRKLRAPLLEESLPGQVADELAAQAVAAGWKRRGQGQVGVFGLLREFVVRQMIGAIGEQIATCCSTRRPLPQPVVGFAIGVQQTVRTVMHQDGQPQLPPAQYGQRQRRHQYPGKPVIVPRRSSTKCRKRHDDPRMDDEPDAAPNDRTIDVHVRRLRSKITGYEDIIRTIRGGGYRFDRHPDVLVDNYQI